MTDFASFLRIYQDNYDWASVSAASSILESPFSSCVVELSPSCRSFFAGPSTFSVFSSSFFDFRLNEAIK